eukprot:COSAG05_NODE_6412_length_963_cov_0.828704_2_plen_87_part_00
MGFTVEDCVLVNLPVEYTGAAAVFAGYVASTTIQHNYIVNTTCECRPSFSASRAQTMQCSLLALLYYTFTLCRVSHTALKCCRLGN